MSDGDMEFSVISLSEPPARGVYDNKTRGYRYSKDVCSSETSIFFPQPKFLVLLPSLLLFGKS